MLGSTVTAAAVAGLARARMTTIVRLAALATSVAALLAGVLAAPAHAAPGGLDSSFGGDGKVVTDFGANDDGANAVAVQPDGKTVAVGYFFDYLGDSPLPAEDFALARYNRDGSLDDTFGSGGKVTTDFATRELTFDYLAQDHATAVGVQPDGRIVVAGWAVESMAFGRIHTDTNFALARYNPDGTLDRSFGRDGRVITDLTGPVGDDRTLSNDIARSLAIQADGRIVVAGVADLGGAAAGGGDFAVVRYDADGTLDAGFGRGGKVTTDFAGELDSISGVALQSDGRIVAAGGASTDGASDAALARYTPTGELDDTFGRGGKVTTDFAGAGDDGASSVAIRPDGRILTAGTTLARYRSNGTLDPSFGDAGRVTEKPTNGFNAIALQLDGKIVVAGSSRAGFSLSRYDADGSPDTDFHGDGTTTADFGDEGGVLPTDTGIVPARAAAVAIQPDGRIVVAGSTSFAFWVYVYPRSFALARFKASGSWEYDPPGHRITTCVNTGVDLNALFGVPESFTCDGRIEAGKPWRPLRTWFVGEFHYAVPEGYVPSAETPIEDLRSKLKGVKVVVDGGTKQETTSTFTPAEALRTDLLFSQLVLGAEPFPMAATLPRLKPLSVGNHTVEVFWALSAMHCDGLGPSVTYNCLPAGDVSMGRHPLTVTKP